MSIPVKISGTQTIRAKVNAPAQTVQVKSVTAGNTPTNNPNLTGTVNVNGELVLAPGTSISANNISLSFANNLTQVITIGDKTTDRTIELEYYMSDGTNNTSGILELSHDDTDIFIDDERTIINNDIDNLDIVGTFVVNDIRLNLIATGDGNTTITFNYTINKILKK